jgi:uncharacterized membrane protein
MTKPNSGEFSANERDNPSGASAILNGRYLPPPADGDGKRWVRASVVIQAPAEELYARWRDVERSTEWRGQTMTVRKTGETTSHWTMQVGDQTLRWNSEILADERGKRIAWRSIDGDLNEAGEAIFESAPGGRGTMVTVLQEYRMGALENLKHTFTGRNPQQGVIESLRHFKALAETGEIPRIEGQSHGPRGTGADMKRSIYGETIPTPPGEMRRAS